jgi:hypothetical protein
MPIDYSMYSTGMAPQVSIGDLIGAAQGVQGIVGNYRQLKENETLRLEKEKKKADELFLNNAFAKGFSQWNGSDPNEFRKISNGVMDNVAKTRPDLYKQALSSTNDINTALQKRLAGDVKIQSAQKDLDWKDRLNQAKAEGVNGGGLSGWRVRGKDWNIVEALPDGPEKEKAYLSYMNKWAPSSGFGASDLGIQAAGKRSAASGYGGAAGRIGAETDAGGGVNPVTTDRTSKLRDEFTNLPEIKSLKGLYQNAKKANDAYASYKAGKASPYEVDQSLGYFASKALDPNSVVMPGEFDRFAKGLGIAGGVQALSSMLINGGLKLTDEQRAAMVNIANRGIMAGAEAAKGQYDYYNSLANEYKISPKGVTGGVDYLFQKDSPQPLKKQPQSNSMPENTPASNYLAEIRARRAQRGQK